MTIALTPAPAAPISSVEVARTSHVSDNVAIGTLRAGVTVLVLAHHAVLAYHPIAPAPLASLVAEPRWWQAFPVVDSQRWAGFALFTWFNDIFFMALMFFISGLFVWNSLLRKGSGSFLRDRAFRLGLSFVVAAALIAPLAYYPSYLQTGAEPSFAVFWRQWLSLGNWPAGPAWFIWLLLMYDAIAAGLFRLTPRWGDRLGRMSESARRHPAVFFGLLVAFSAAAYIPMALAFTPLEWTEFGPFFFQTSRLFLYAVYFLAGVGVGAYGLERGLLAPDGKLAQGWPLWLFASLVAFGLTVYVTLMILAMPGEAISRDWAIAGGLTFVLSCAASAFGFLALFVRFAGRRVRALDSLRDNAFGMYLIHYPIVGWLQLSLLRAPLSAPAKGAWVFVSTVALSWAATAALRRFPAVARVI